MKDSIDSLQQHTQQYWNIDGLAEIAIGVFFLLLSLNFFGIRLGSFWINDFAFLPKRESFCSGV